MKLPTDNAARAALGVVQRLHDAGHAAVFAGGCVRDMLLGSTPKDYDVATDAHPPKVVELFPKSRQVGAKFGVVLVRKSGFDIEVATFRADGTYSDGRRPDSVVFGGEVEDARRRDFTINGLFFDPLAGRLIDHVAGQADLEARVLRTIGDPGKRFEEDHLRILRAVRFASRWNLAVDPGLEQAARAMASQLNAISPERVWMELERILTASTRECGWRLLADWGIVRHLTPGWSPSEPQQQRIKTTFASFSPNPLPAHLVPAVLFGDEPDALVEQRCCALRLSNRMTDSARWTAGSASALRGTEVVSLADLKRLMGGQDWPGLMRFLRADWIARGRNSDFLDELARRAGTIAAEDVAPPPLLSGEDLKGMGMLPGPTFGRVLDAVYRSQLDETIRTLEEAKALARTLMNSVG